MLTGLIEDLVSYLMQHSRYKEFLEFTAEEGAYTEKELDEMLRDLIGDDYFIGFDYARERDERGQKNHNDK